METYNLLILEMNNGSMTFADNSISSQISILCVGMSVAYIRILTALLWFNFGNIVDAFQCMLWLLLRLKERLNLWEDKIKIYRNYWKIEIASCSWMVVTIYAKCIHFNFKKLVTFPSLSKKPGFLEPREPSMDLWLGKP